MATFTKSKDAPEGATSWKIPGANITLDDQNSTFTTDDPEVAQNLRIDSDFDEVADEQPQAQVEDTNSHEWGVN